MNGSERLIVDRKITIERAGVMQLSYDTFRVNADDLTTLLGEEVSKMQPKTDYNGSFAARIKIELEFLGDMNTEIV